MSPSWYDRENWYRIPEREKTLVPADLSLGDLIVPKRVIVRCGYYYNYTDAPTRELNEISVELLAARTGHDKNECLNIIQAMEIGHPKGLFSWTQKYRSLKGLYYDARRSWVHRQPAHNGTAANYRTFWYVDLPSKEEWRHIWDSPARKILHKGLKMIGKPDVEYEYGEFGSSYCVGTYFAEHGRQTLYYIAPFSSRIEFGYGPDRYWYVHPLDAEKVDDNASDV